MIMIMMMTVRRSFNIKVDYSLAGNVGWHNGGQKWCKDVCDAEDDDIEN